MDYEKEWNALRELIVWRKTEFSNYKDQYGNGRFDSYESLLRYIEDCEKISENQESET